MWAQLGSNFEIPMTTVSNDFAVDVQSFVNSQYPVDQDQPTTEISTTTYETENVVIFNETDCFIYGGGIAGCILLMFFCNHQMKKDRQKKLAYRIEINRRMKE